MQENNCTFIKQLLKAQLNKNNIKPSQQQSLTLKRKLQISQLQDRLSKLQSKINDLNIHSDEQETNKISSNPGLKVLQSIQFEDKAQEQKSHRKNDINKQYNSSSEEDSVQYFSMMLSKQRVDEKKKKVKKDNIKNCSRVSYKSACSNISLNRKCQRYSSGIKLGRNRSIEKKSKKKRLNNNWKGKQNKMKECLQYVGMKMYDPTLIYSKEKNKIINQLDRQINSEKNKIKELQKEVRKIKKERNPTNKLIKAIRA